MVYSSVLLDYESGLEIYFARPAGAKFSYPNEVKTYPRSRDNRTVSRVSSAGMREIEFNIETETSPVIERTLDYFRRTGKAVLLFLPSSEFASEIVIKDFNVVQRAATTQIFVLSAYCYGVEGSCIRTSDSRCTGQVASHPDGDAISGIVPVLNDTAEYVGLEVDMDNVWLPAGTWNVFVRAISLNGVANNLTFGLYDEDTDAWVGSDTVTAGTTAYTFYGVSATVTSAMEGHLAVMKALTAVGASDVIYIDLIAYVEDSGDITV